MRSTVRTSRLLRAATVFQRPSCGGGSALTGCCSARRFCKLGCCGELRRISLERFARSRVPSRLPAPNLGMRKNLTHLEIAVSEPVDSLPNLFGHASVRRFHRDALNTPLPFITPFMIRYSWVRTRTVDISRFQFLTGLSVL